VSTEQLSRLLPPALGIAAGVALFLLAKSGKSNPYLWLGLLGFMAAVGIWAGITIFSTHAPSLTLVGTAWRLWRTGVMVAVVLATVSAFGIYTWPFPPAPISVPTLAPAPRQVQTEGPRIQVRDFLMVVWQIGQAMTGLAIFRNTGKADAHVATIGYTYPIPTPAPGVRAAVEEELFRDLSARFGNDTPQVVWEPGKDYVLTNSGPVLTKNQYDEWTKGAFTVYFLGIIRYEDEHGKWQTEYCRYWDINVSGRPFSCRTHNVSHVTR
jgi:hypothetical protein